MLNYKNNELILLTYYIINNLFPIKYKIYEIKEYKKTIIIKRGIYKAYYITKKLGEIHEKSCYKNR
ncbi:hypothetical protein NL43_00495 [Methanosphaera sp. WGK6]|nr:hypothetical protein NL43_00495 [Methanosphaera sp. WGK6]